jgi:moderate conductance mechanosensitive channel
MRAALVIVVALMFGAPSWAQPAAPADAPPQVQELVKLLGDPAVRTWLEQQHGAAAPPAAPREPEATSGLGHLFGGRVAAIRDHFGQLVIAFPELPGEFARARDKMRVEFEERGLIGVLILFASFAALGVGAQWLYYTAMAGVRRRMGAAALDTVGHRLRAVGARFAFGLGVISSAAVGTFGAFLVFDWPPVLGEVVFSFLIAFLAQRLATVLGRVLLAPGGPMDVVERFRIVPMSNQAAQFWFTRIVVLASWVAFGAVFLNLAGVLGLTQHGILIVAYVFDLGILAILLEVTWRRPVTTDPRRFSRRTVSWLVTGYFLLLYVLRVANAMDTFFLLVFAGALPAAIRIAQNSVSHILRPPGAPDASTAIPSVHVVAFERGIRTALIIGAAWLLTRAWNLDMMAMTASDSMFARLVRGALSALVIVLVADFTWQLVKATIDGKLAAAVQHGPADGDDARRLARLRTLLPILRTTLFVVLIAVAGMMALSALGVEIGPLIAGAGVAGVALGFGAQTLVRDVISGMFYLLDDAFRIGEYIQAGNYKGTVESFSLRSIKLRHHRGPLYTIPFGSLGAVQNMSRDWVIEKFQVGVTYDTDLEKVKKLIKQIGKELMQDPELAPHIIETLKMQGVEQFGDYAIQVRMKMMTKPGEQFVVRRKALALIKKAFDANGVRFAFPTVQIAGGEDPGATATAVARQGLELVKPAASATP